MNSISLIISDYEGTKYLLCNFYVNSKTETDKNFVLNWWEANKRVFGEIIVRRICFGENPKQIFRDIAEQIECCVGFETRYAMPDSICRMLIMMTPPNNSCRQEDIND